MNKLDSIIFGGGLALMAAGFLYFLLNKGVLGLFGLAMILFMAGLAALIYFINLLK